MGSHRLFSLVGLVCITFILIVTHYIVCGVVAKLHLTSFIFIVLLLLFYFYSGVNKYYYILLDSAAVLPATRHKCTQPALTPATEAGILDLPTPEGWKADRGRQRKRWIDVVKYNIEDLRLDLMDVENRAQWRRRGRGMES